MRGALCRFLFLSESCVLNTLNFLQHVMKSQIAVTLIILITVTLGHDNDGHYTNDWVVRISGGRRIADQLAAELDYENIGELKGFADTYIMRKSDHPQRSRRNAAHLTKRLADDGRVEWAEQQVIKSRVKRGLIRTKRNDMKIPAHRENSRFNDYLWPDQWYLHDTRNMVNLPRLDLRTIPVWNMGYTGKGTVVTVMDDGLEWNHTDIRENYDPKASWDTNDDDPDPFPRYDESNSNNHGTRCAGEIAMTANNGKCGVGVAYNAKIGGIRMLDGPVNDAVESVSLAHNVHHIDIFSASWGPNDDGMTVDGPKRLAVEALEKGIREGRGGRGVIYVWASGNGGTTGDNCNCDGYTNSIYTLSVGSASQHGEFPWYGERCASTMTVTYSSGAYTDQKILSFQATTDLHNDCTIHHTGTSAAAPLAAGIVALMLEANPELTWRDMQHIVAWNSENVNLHHNHGWKRNAAGLMYNSRFGFGLMSAEAMVKAALNWTNVPQKSMCKIQANNSFPLPVSSTTHSEVEIDLTSDGCAGGDDEINYLEHVEVTVDIEYTHRGALDIFLFSPSNSVSMLLSPREKDSSIMGFRNWTFLSVHFWGENPSGKWKIMIRDKVGKGYSGQVKGAYITLHGTKEMPSHMHQGRKRYANEAQLEKIIDRTPEFEVKPTVSDDDAEDELDDLENGIGKIKLDWNDLVGKQLRNSLQPESAMDRLPETEEMLFEHDAIDFVSNYYDYL